MILTSIFYILNQVLVGVDSFPFHFISLTFLTIHKNLTPSNSNTLRLTIKSPQIGCSIVAPMASFNSINAEFALMQLWKEVRSKPEDPESSNVEIPSPLSTKDAVISAINNSTEFADTTPPIRIPHTFTTTAARYLLNPTELEQRERQLLVVSMTNGTSDNPDRRMVALSVPHIVAKQILALSVAIDLSHPVLPQFTDDDAARMLVAMSNSATRDNHVTKESAMRRLLELLTPNDTVRSEPISNVFTTSEFVIVVKLINFLACRDTAELYSAVTGLNEQEFRATHLLLNRFEFPRRQLNVRYEFDAGDVAAAHQVLALFNATDPPPQVGPLYLVYPAGPGARLKQLVRLSDGDGVECHIIDAYNRGYVATATE